jgi:hypothetical protein
MWMSQLTTPPAQGGKGRQGVNMTSCALGAGGGYTHCPSRHEPAPLSQGVPSGALKVHETVQHELAVPFAVPSSQASVPWTMPSPQIGTVVEVVLVVVVGLVVVVLVPGVGSHALGIESPSLSVGSDPQNAGEVAPAQPLRPSVPV